MVKFHSLSDGKRMVRETVFLFGFCVEMSSFFAENSARVKLLVSITCRLFRKRISFFVSW